MAKINGKASGNLLEEKRGEETRRYVGRFDAIRRTMGVPNPDNPTGPFQHVEHGMKGVRLFLVDFWKSPNDFDVSSTDVEALAVAASAADSASRNVRGDSEEYMALRFFAWSCREKIREINAGGLERQNLAPVLAVTEND